MNAPAAAERNAAYHEIASILDQFPVGEQYHLLLRLLHSRDPDKIPVKVDGRRMSTEESLRRMAFRKDRTANTGKDEQ